MRTEIENNESVTNGDGIIIGRNAVTEALRAGVSIDKVFIAKGEADKALGHIAGAARGAGIPVVEADKRKLDSLCAGSRHSGQYIHQGVVAMAAYTEYSTIEEILGYARDLNQEPLICICDEISDPHNLGAIIRTCEAAGVHGVIIPKRRNAGLGATVSKASSGAIYHIRIARVTNITAAIQTLKKQNIWIFGAVPGGGITLWKSDFTGATAIVIGSEGKGISRLVSEACDFRVSIPMDGRLASLNASVSASILLYEAVRQRR